MAGLLFLQINLNPVVWTVLGLVAAIGLIAVLSPKWFSALSHGSNTWVDTNKVLQTLDKRVDIDKYVAPYCRYLGAAVLVAVGVIALVYAKFLAQ